MENKPYIILAVPNRIDWKKVYVILGQVYGNQNFLNVCFINGFRIYVDIMTGEKLFSISVPNIDIIYWSFPSSSSRMG